MAYMDGEYAPDIREETCSACRHLEKTKNPRQKKFFCRKTGRKGSTLRGKRCVNFELLKDIDVTGIELTPGDPANCAGNGKQDPMRCCCDECDYMQLCMEHKEFWQD